MPNQRIVETLKETNYLLGRLNLKIQEFTVAQYDHFANIKNEIDIKRETLLLELEKEANVSEKLFEDILKTSAQMISQVEVTEEGFRMNFTQIKLNLLRDYDPSALLKGPNLNEKFLETLIVQLKK